MMLCYVITFLVADKGMCCPSKPNLFIETCFTELHPLEILPACQARRSNAKTRREVRACELVSCVRVVFRVISSPLAATCQDWFAN